MSDLHELTSAIRQLDPEQIEARRQELREEDRLLRALLRNRVGEALDQRRRGSKRTA